MCCYRVMIADDDAEAAAELQERLIHVPEIRIVGIADTGARACEMAGRLLPDVILMDIEMPAMNGIEATRCIKRDFPQIQIVILTVFQDTPHMFEAIRAGAMSYLVKGCSASEIVSEVKAVMAGEGSIPPAQVRSIRDEFDRLEQKVAALRHLYETLSKTEMAILTYVAQGKTNPQIARLMGTEATTIKGHVTAILKKLHVNGRVEAAELAERTGLASNAGKSG